MKRKKIRDKIKFRLLGTKQLKGRRQQSGYTYIQERGMFRREDKQTNRKISKKKKKLSLANTLSKSTLPKNLAPMIPIPNHHIQKKKNIIQAFIISSCFKQPPHIILYFQPNQKNP